MTLVVDYDLTRQPASIGDPITTAVGASIIARQRGLDDIHFVFNPDCPQELLLAPKVCPMVTRVSVVNNFERNGYENVWPERDAPYLFYRLNDEIIGPNAHLIPKLTTGYPRPWYAPYVSVNLRVASTQTHRNSNIPAWQAFMGRHPETTFVTIGDVDRQGMTRMQSLMDDLAVIEFSDFHMGTVSGPCEMVRFSDKPYAVWGPLLGETEHGMKSWSNNRWSWAKPGQNWLREEEHLEHIEREYQAWRSRSYRSVPVPQPI